MKDKRVVFLVSCLVVLGIIFSIELVSLGILKANNGNYLEGNDEIDNNKGNDLINKDEVNNEMDNSLSNFDLSFLKLENDDKNKVYSPISIKYALKMIEEAALDNSKKQISNLLSNYQINKYTNSSNMSFANALFIKDTYKSNVKQSYIDKLTNDYNASVIYDKLISADNINSWIKNKTLNLIDNMLDDSQVNNTDFWFINALGIDMEWENKFLRGVLVEYSHENFYWGSELELYKSSFANSEDVVSMEVQASFNNYDIVNVLGEDNIRETVGSDYRQFIINNPEYYKNITSEEEIDKEVNDYLDGYIESINKNYGKEDKNTDFSLYVDDDVKVFAKDLKEYDGLTLQYVAIMPKNESLNTYIDNIDTTKINAYISNLKELKKENFKDGVITKIEGYIPKFKIEYNLDLTKDLKNMGITDIFDSKANLTDFTTVNNAYISEVIHKANIEFSQDGIKAAAVTTIGGYGAASLYDYKYEVPVEIIDITFDKPYMYLIRNKDTNEVWFTGTVYEPMLCEDTLALTGNICNSNK